MMNIDKSIRKIIGKPKAFGGRKDWDGDGVPNKRDCQPRNVMRQDKVKRFNYKNHTISIKKNNQTDMYDVWLTAGYMGQQLAGSAKTQQEAEMKIKKAIDIRQPNRGDYVLPTGISF